ncbi:MAG: sulfite exporter TauE/SafE family protein, partial [Magnetococcales bacterium]|nr:sulfite exporter TauE/SafE family protein [Magnetococcales bacterium]
MIHPSLSSLFQPPVLFSGLSWYQLLPAWAAVTLGALIQGTIGFGIALIAAPLLLILNPHLIPGPLMLATLFLTVLTWWRERKEVLWRDIPVALSGRIIGTVIGTTAMAILPVDLLVATMGVLLILAAIMSSKIPPFHPSKRVLVLAGLLSGVMGTMTSAGGPPMLLAYQHIPGPRMRATLGAFFSIGILLSLVSLAAIQRFGIAEGLMGLSFVPAILGKRRTNPRVPKIFQIHDSRSIFPTQG